MFLAYFDEKHLGDYLEVAAALRRGGIAVEFFPEPKKLGQQLKVAAKKGFPAALIIGTDEFAAGTAQLKHLATQQSTTIQWGGDTAALAAAVRQALTSAAKA